MYSSYLLHVIINFFIFFPLQPYSTARKTVVYSSLTFVLVETYKIFMSFVKYAIAALFKLIFSLSLHSYSCHW